MGFVSWESSQCDVDELSRARVVVMVMVVVVGDDDDDDDDVVVVVEGGHAGCEQEQDEMDGCAETIVLCVSLEYDTCLHEI